MEGFVEPQPKDARQSSRLNEAQVIERWLALLVAAVLVMVAAALLLTRDL